jgi:carbamoyl-phosphate synthase small subunit
LTAEKSSCDRFARVGERAARIAGNHLGISMAIAKLALEDGIVFTGTAFGARGESDGEVVFNTAMTGYQEILTDPSYHGQIVTMTYPQIGNTGVNDEDNESSRPWVRGFVVREISKRVDSWRATGSLPDFLEKHGVIGISGIDTRMLVKHIREEGAMKGVISTIDTDDVSLVAKAKASPGLIGRDLTREVMTKESRTWETGLDHSFLLRPIDPVTQMLLPPVAIDPNARKPHVVALDFGLKWNILRHLVEIGCKVTVMPGSAPAEAILERNFDGIFISNGPGDPAALSEATEMCKALMRTAAESRGAPIFGICLGHQLLGQAWGAKTYKLKFGHRGVNHPVRNNTTGKVEITTQNHGFAVDPSSLPADVELTHINLNDETLEGMRHKRLPIFCVQYHPEASAGPHDSHYLFNEFRRMLG